MTVLGCAAGPIAFARPPFPNPVFEVGHNPWMLVHGDFNGDGKADLAVNDAGYDYPELGGVSILLGRGDGSFSDRIVIATQNKPASLQICDLNADGKTDLVISHYDARALSVLIGNGDGTFGPEQTVAMTFRPFRVAAADFDGDARTDLAVSGTDNDGQGYFQVFLGAGNGSLVDLPALPTGLYPGHTESADVNEDGRADLIIATLDMGVRVYLGLGDGHFAAGFSPPGGGTSRDVLLGDFNADGHVDLATETSSVLLGNGDGTFTAVPPSGEVLALIGSSDFNADGRTDLLVVNLSFELAALLGRGDGTFDVRASSTAVVDVGPFVVGDFDRDGRMDLVGINGLANAVIELFGNGDGTFGPAPFLSLSGAEPSAVSIGDFNLDGQLDVAVPDALNDAVVVALGLGGGVFAPGHSYPLPGAPSFTLARDLDRDGRDDLLVSFDYREVPHGGVAVLLSLPDGSFMLPTVVPVGVSPFGMTTADLNLDGSLDLIVPNQGYLGGGLVGDLSIVLGNGDGSFAPASSLGVGVVPNWAAVGDFNGDGSPDLAVTHLGDFYSGVPGDLSVLLGGGDGSFGQRNIIASGVAPSCVAVRDLDNDGRDDLAFVDGGTLQFAQPADLGHVSVFLGRGNGTFAAGVSSPAGPTPRYVVAGDFNADTLPDLAVTNGSGYVSIFPGVGSGAFSPSVSFGLTTAALSLAAADFNSDGRPDFALASSAGVFIMSNQGLAGQAIVEGSFSFSSPDGKGSGTVFWRTGAEFDLRGFNVVSLDPSGRRIQWNPVLIPCEECATGRGLDYVTFIPKHRSGRNLYVEAIHLDGRLERFGPLPRR